MPGTGQGQQKPLEPSAFTAGFFNNAHEWGLPFLQFFPLSKAHPNA